MPLGPTGHEPMPERIPSHPPPEPPELMELPIPVSERAVRGIIFSLILILLIGATCVVLVGGYQWLQMTMP